MTQPPRLPGWIQTHSYGSLALEWTAWEKDHNGSGLFLSTQLCFHWGSALLHCVWFGWGWQSVSRQAWPTIHSTSSLWQQWLVQEMDMWLIRTNQSASLGFIHWHTETPSLCCSVSLELSTVLFLTCIKEAQLQWEIMSPIYRWKQTQEMERERESWWLGLSPGLSHA